MKIKCVTFSRDALDEEFLPPEGRETVGEVSGEELGKWLQKSQTKSKQNLCEWVFMVV